jgi:DNA-binding CsgD family transcriptional regulator
VDRASPPRFKRKQRLLLEAAQRGAGDRNLTAWLQQWITLLTQHTAAQRGVLLVADPGQGAAAATVATLRVEAECQAGSPPRVLQSERLLDQSAAEATAPHRAVNFVAHSGQSLALTAVSWEVPFDSDPALVLAPALAGMSAMAQSRYDQAEQHLRRAAESEAATPDASLLVQPSLLLAHALYAQGAVEPALEVLIPVLETCRRERTPGLVVQEGAAVIPVLRLAAQQGCCGPAAAHVLRLLGVSNVARRLLLPETGIVLSPREVDVLELLAATASNRAIAERLDVDIATVKSHVTRVLAKLGVPTRYEAAERARALGLGNGW